MVGAVGEVDPELPVDAEQSVERVTQMALVASASPLPVFWIRRGLHREQYRPVATAPVGGTGVSLLGIAARREDNGPRRSDHIRGEQSCPHHQSVEAVG
jgi:hypothetical protein